MFAPLAVALSLLSLVNAQASNSSALGIAAIEAHFSQSGLVPSLLSSFNPSALLTVSYAGVGTISPGQNLTKDQVTPTPQLTVTPANSSVTLTGNYTLVMADADIVGTVESVGQTRHWLVNGVTLTGSSAPFNVSTASGVGVTEYAGPAPASGSGAHRYVILLLPQPSDFSPPSNLTKPNVGVSVFELTEYISSSHLGAPVAGMYLQVETGISTASVSATSPVISSTLQVSSSSATSTGSSSSSSSSGTATPSNKANAARARLPDAPFALLVAVVFGLFAL